MLVALAATVDGRELPHPMQSIGDVSLALVPLFGNSGARMVFSLGVMGAAMVAAIVSSLALSWAISEASGYTRSEHQPGAESPWFYIGYGLCVAAGAALVGWQDNLVWLDLGTQVINTFMLPVLIIVLIRLVQTSTPKALRLRGGYLVLLVSLSVLACGLGIVGGLEPLLSIIK